MSVYIKALPTLSGQPAERFVKQTIINFQNRASIDFSKEYDNSCKILAKKKNKQLE